MIDLVRTLVRDVGVPLHEAIAMASTNPARALEMKAKGSLDVGMDADFVVLSPELEVVKTFVASEEIYSAA
jgi:N-acetylglucosamine-6-phosphate deacetylase